MSDLLDLDLNIEGPNPWKTESSRVIYDNGRLRLREDLVIQPDGAPGSYTFRAYAYSPKDGTSYEGLDTTSFTVR